MQEIPHILGFTAGELTPWLSARYDLQAYQRGAAHISNFIVQPYGGVKRRNGTRFVAEAGSGSADAVKLFPFSYSEADALMLEFFPGGMRVYRDGKALMVPNGGEVPGATDAEQQPAADVDAQEESTEGIVSVNPPPPLAPAPIAGPAKLPYQLSVPWKTAEQILSLRFTQVNDAVYVTCPSYRPVVLYRNADTDWRCEEPELEPYPRELYTCREERLTVRPDAAGKTAELQLPEDGGAVFTPDMEGVEYVLAEAEVAEKTLFRSEGFAAGSVTLLPLRQYACKRGTVYAAAIAGTSGMMRFWTCIRDYAVSDYNGSDNPDDYSAFFLPGAVWSDAGKPYEVCRDWELRTTGTWNAQWELWRSYDTPQDDADFLRWNWTCIKSFGQSPYSERENWALSGSEEQPCRMLLVCREASSATVPAFLFFRCFRGSREYKLRITSVQNAHAATAEICSCYTDAPQLFATRRWSFGAMGAVCGYPSFASYSAGRLWFGGMRKAPTTLIGSVTDDFHNFRVSSAEDSALHLTIASDNQSRICWIAPTRQLLVGSSDGIWMLGSGDGAPLSPMNAAFRRQTSVGCENLPALAVEGCVIFSQRAGTRLREISYKLESDGFAASDLSLLAEHLLRAGVREYAVQEGLGSYVWVVLQDGSLAVLTLHPEQQVSAWQRVDIPGCKVLHVATLPRAGAELDEVWLVLRRGEEEPLTLQRLCADNPYLDDVSTISTNEEGRAVRLERYAGQEVCLADAAGEWSRHRVSSAGTLDALPPNAVFELGYPYTSSLQTMPLESLNSFNSVRELSRLRLRLLESSLNMEYKATHAARWERLEPDRMHLSEPYTGSVRFSHMPEAAVGQGLCLRCTGPKDVCLLGLTVEVDYHGK